MSQRIIRRNRENIRQTWKVPAFQRSPVAVFILLTLIAVPAVFSACQSRSGETKTINIGLNWDLTGPVSEGGGLFLDTFRDYVSFFEEKGGIKGAKINLLWSDSGYSIPRVLSNYARFKEAGVVAIQIQASLEAYTLKPIAERDHIPLISTAVDAANYYPPGWVFTAGGGSTGDMFAVFLKWLQANWKESRPPRIAIIGWDNTLGRAPLAAKKYIDDSGVQIVAQEYVPVPTMDYSGQLLRIREAKPDYIFVGIASGGFGPFLKDAERTGVRGKIPMVTNGVVPLFQAMGPAGDLAEGLYSFNTRAMYQETNIPGIREMQDYMVRTKGRPTDTDTVTWAWTDMKAILEFVKKAAEEVGADKVTGEDVKNVIERTRNLDMNGITKPLSYGTEKRRGNDYARMVQVKGGKVVALSDWMEIPVVK